MMLKSLSFENFSLLFLWPCLQGLVDSILVSRFHKYRAVDQIYGKVSEYNGARTVIGCIIYCLRHTDCKAALFNRYSGGSKKCLQVRSGMNFINITDYEYFNIRRCADPSFANYDFLTDAGLPCPKLYFPLDTDTGTRRGSSPGNVQFVSGGKVGGAFLNPVTSSIRSYYNLGYYPSSEFCFPLAENCPLGITVAFWLKILGDLDGDKQGILTTRPQVFK